MNTPVQRLLDAFDTLSAAEKHQATVEILRRCGGSEGDLSNDALVQAAGDLFLALDREESDNATR